MISIPLLSRKRKVLDVKKAKKILESLGVGLEQFRDRDFPHFNDTSLDAESFRRTVYNLNINFYEGDGDIIMMRVRGKYGCLVKCLYKKDGICRPGPESIANIDVIQPCSYSSRKRG